MHRNVVRTTVGIVAAAATALSLAACGTSGTSSTPAATELSDEPVTLRITWWGGDGRHERTQQAIDLFEEAHPNITVEAEFTDWTGYWEKLATTTAGNNAPDVMQMDQLYLASYADRGTLADLAPFDLDVSGTEDSVLEMGQLDGVQYAMPISTSALALLVNADLVEQLGVGMPQDTDTWTWDDFAAWSQSITDASGGAVVGGGPLYNEFALQVFARQNGDDLFSDGEISIDPDTLADFFQMDLDWTKDGTAPSASQWSETYNLALDQLPFSVGSAASIFTPATLVTAYSTATGADIQAVPLPSVDGGETDFDYFKPGMYWAASSTSDHPVEAAALIDFLLNDPAATKIIGTERGLPAKSTTLDEISATLTPEEQKAVAFSETRLPFLGDAPEVVPNGAADIEAVLQRHLQDVLFERSTPQAAAEAMIAEVQSSISAAN